MTYISALVYPFCKKYSIKAVNPFYHPTVPPLPTPISEFPCINTIGYFYGAVVGLVSAPL